MYAVACIAWCGINEFNICRFVVVVVNCIVLVVSIDIVAELTD